MGSGFQSSQERNLHRVPGSRERNPQRVQGSRKPETLWEFRVLGNEILGGLRVLGNPKSYGGSWERNPQRVQGSGFLGRGPETDTPTCLSS